MNLEKIIKYVEAYAKTRSSHGITREDKAEIIKLHDELIPMDVKLDRKGSEDCGSCISKALARFGIHLDILKAHYEGTKETPRTAKAQPKKKRGRPRKKK